MTSKAEHDRRLELVAGMLKLCAEMFTPPDGFTYKQRVISGEEMPSYDPKMIVVAHKWTGPDGRGVACITAFHPIDFERNRGQMQRMNLVKNMFECTAMSMRDRYEEDFA